MPLSEEEQRILHQIEEQLKADPSFDLKATQRGQSGASPRHLVWSSVVLVVSLFVVVAALQISALLSFVAFIVMVVAGVFLERELTGVAPPVGRRTGEVRGERDVGEAAQAGVGRQRLDGEDIEAQAEAALPGDPHEAGLVDDALKHNYDHAIAMERLREMPIGSIHSRKLRSFEETAFL